MKSFSRRDVLKSSLLAPAIAVAAHDLSPMAAAMEVAGLNPDPQAEGAPSQTPTPSAGRERLLLDFGWRFHFGDADDPAKDFGFGSGRTGNFQKTGNFLPAGSTPSTIATGSRRLAPRLGHRAAFQERSRSCQQRLLSARPQLSRLPVSAGTGASSSFPQPTRASGSPSSSTARTARRWSSSTAFTSAGTAADTILSASMSPTSPIPAAETCCWCASTPRRAMAGSTRAQESTATCGWSRRTLST